ncbi:hypothetical protein [Peribacillus sp. N1]
MILFNFSACTLIPLPIFNISHDYELVRLSAVTSSAPADVSSAISSTSCAASIVHFPIDGQQA